MEDSRIPPESDTAVMQWMRSKGWDVGPARHHQLEPGSGFYAWLERSPRNNSHALWIADTMVRQLPARELVSVLDRQGIAEDIKISFKIRIEERGSEYRVSLVPRSSGEFRVQE